MLEISLLLHWVAMIFCMIVGSATETGKRGVAWFATVMGGSLMGIAWALALEAR